MGVKQNKRKLGKKCKLTENRGFYKFSGIRGNMQYASLLRGMDAPDG